jgi:hypothetical protein
MPGPPRTVPGGFPHKSLPHTPTSDPSHCIRAVHLTSTFCWPNGEYCAVIVLEVTLYCRWSDSLAWICLVQAGQIELAVAPAGPSAVPHTLQADNHGAEHVRYVVLFIQVKFVSQLGLGRPLQTFLDDSGVVGVQSDAVSHVVLRSGEALMLLRVCCFSFSLLVYPHVLDTAVLLRKSCRSATLRLCGWSSVR